MTTLVIPAVPAAVQGISWLSAWPPRNPLASDGRELDFWLNQLTSLTFQKRSGRWEPLFKLKGSKGNPGDRGNRGLSVLYGNAVPSNTTVGENGEYYVREGQPEGPLFYGPKSGGAWPAPRPIQLIITGSGAPSNSLGLDGQIYVDQTNLRIYAAKAGGVWPAPVSLVGPAPFGTIGNWATSTAYVAVGPNTPASLKRRGSSVYIALVSHTSGDFDTDLAAGKWAFLIRDGADAGFRYVWSAGTSGAPGTGKIGVDNATFPSVANIRIADTDASGNDLIALLTAWGGAVNPVKGTITIADPAAPGNFLELNVTAAPTNGGGYRNFTVAFVASHGAFSADTPVIIRYSRSGNTGYSGTGTGNVNPMGTVAADDIAAFGDNTGTLIKKAAKATTADAQAGTDDIGWVSSAKVKDAIVANKFADYQEFLTSGTWTKNAQWRFVYVEGVGGGGGGRSDAGGGSSGGGDGGWGNGRLMRAVDITSPVTVTVGAGGAPGNPGAAGGDSTFGSYLTAKGGRGGTAVVTMRPIMPSPNFAYGEGGGGTDHRDGGASIKGGGGGGCGNAGGQGAGGASAEAGAGGAGSVTVASNGQVPGGGGGGIEPGYSGTGGSGASGRVRVWAW